MGLLDLVRQVFWLAPIETPRLASPDVVERSGSGRGPLMQFILDESQVGRRRASHILRHLADQDEWVRTAINRRRRQISQAKWSIVRIDDNNKKADPRVVREARRILQTINPKRESLRTLLDKIVEDILVLDAGCIEVESTLSGGIAALYDLDGATIRPLAGWDGTKPNAPRYEQVIHGRVVADFRNEDLIYIMANPRSNSVRGFSPVEWLIASIEHDLYGEQFDFDMLRQSAPQGFLHLGELQEESVERYREYYESEIAGTRKIAIGGGPGEPKFISMQHSSADLERQKYREWKATKIAALFEMDLGVFNLTSAIHKSIGEKQERLTDEGHVSLGTLVQEFFTRELIWRIDENHAFVFDDLNARGAKAQSDLDKTYISIGVTTPNEIRAREGYPDKLPWGDLPFVPGKGPWMGPTAGEPVPQEDDATEDGLDPGDDDSTDGALATTSESGDAANDTSTQRVARKRRGARSRR